MDLSNTGLTENHIKEFGTALRRSKSLRCIHFSVNNLSQNIVDYLVKRTHGVLIQKVKKLK